MKKKFVLPMMAFVFAIGLSFATERSTADPILDYVDVGAENPVPILEVNCGVGQIECSGIFAGETTDYPIYDDENLENRKMGSSGIVNLPSRN